MDKFVIEGCKPLHGAIPTSGSKNSALPALAAALLTEDKVVLKRVPRVRDIRTMERLLQDIGSYISVDDECVTIETPSIVSPEAPYELVKTMRASSLVLGPLVARAGRARVSLPGGCAIGARPINLHLAGLEQLGAKISQEHGYVEASAPGGLKGARIVFDRITVTGTEYSDGVGAGGGRNRNRECGARTRSGRPGGSAGKNGGQIEGAGTSVIRIEGVSRLHGAEHEIIADRIEAGTFVLAGAITGGDLKITGCVAGSPQRADRQTRHRPACDVTSARRHHHPRAARRRAACGGYDDRRVSRFRHRSAGPVYGADDAGRRHLDRRRDDLRKPLHARPGTDAHGREHPSGGPAGHCCGPQPLYRRGRDRFDLRASASLVLAALVAKGETVIDRVYHIDRGMKKSKRNWPPVGADIRRVE